MSLSFLTPTQIEDTLNQLLASFPYDNKSVLVLVPDLTRTMPLPLFFRLIEKQLQPRVRRLDFMIALGTHAPLNEAQICQLFGLTSTADYPHIAFLNHAWDDSESLTEVGTIPAARVKELSQGLMAQPIPVRLNRHILDYEELLICGPVFPHEVAGFSGGNKYLFPGIAGQEIIDVTHWIGALVTSFALIGVKDTPVRRLIDEAASLVPRPRRALCSVVEKGGVSGIFGGLPEQAWNQAADLAAQTHITWVDRPYKTVLSLLPKMYDEIWVGAKGMYKLEPVIQDGGEVILYAPHIQHLSVVHGDLIRKIGYHCRDYFTGQWDKFKNYPWGVLAHSTHLRGAGQYNPSTGQENLRIQVTLATQISQQECLDLNLGWRDWRTIDLDEWKNEAKTNPDLLVVPDAGEQLYRLRKPEC